MRKVNNIDSHPWSRGYGGQGWLYGYFVSNRLVVSPKNTVPAWPIWHSSVKQLIELLQGHSAVT